MNSVQAKVLFLMKKKEFLADKNEIKVIFLPKIAPNNALHKNTYVNFKEKYSSLMIRNLYFEKTRNFISFHMVDMVL